MGKADVFLLGKPCRPQRRQRRRLAHLFGTPTGSLVLAANSSPMHLPVF